MFVTENVYSNSGFMKNFKLAHSAHTHINARRAYKIVIIYFTIYWVYINVCWAVLAVSSLSTRRITPIHPPPLLL